MFSSKIKCADCGSWYGPKIWHSNDRYRRVVYRCNNKYKGSEKCQTAHVTEEEVREAFIKAYNRLVSEKNEIIANAELVRTTLCDTSDLPGWHRDTHMIGRKRTHSMRGCVCYFWSGNPSVIIYR
ncbi:zinc ribbon domain-containing protein [Eubacterium pyruvativorans]|uniref:zinc ribbon domain-containing protein n=1 Tax=Eubacterium pyruvativorans TaxID=155865 RepID=UPI00311A365F